MQVHPERESPKDLFKAYRILTGLLQAYYTSCECAHIDSEQLHLGSADHSEQVQLCVFGVLFGSESTHMSLHEESTLTVKL